VFVPDSAAKSTFSRGVDVAGANSRRTLDLPLVAHEGTGQTRAVRPLQRQWQHGGAWEGRLVKFPDSYEILDPQEAPDFRGYARILRKRLPTVLIVFFILFSIALIATLPNSKPV